MSSDLRQNTSLNQRLHMTPMLKKAITLLTYSHAELITAIRNELEENPFLEEDFECSPLDLEKNTEDCQCEEPSETSQNVLKEIENSNFSSVEEWENYLGEFSHQSNLTQNEKTDNDKYNFFIESYHEVKNGLAAHLFAQLLLVNLSDRQRRIAECIIGNLDDNGYLIASDFEIAELAAVEPEEIPSILNIVRSFEPVGIASRSLTECLITQIRKNDFEDSDILINMVSSYLSDLENKSYKTLQKKLHIDSNKFKECLSHIQSLNPRPGAGYSGNMPPSIIPDLIVKKIGSEFVVILNDEDLPCLRISEQAEELLQKKTEYPKQEQSYFDEHYASAVTVIKNIEERQRCLYRVMVSIVKKQSNFFSDGPLYLKPLILKDIAQDIGKSESSVSRITTNKYVSTPFGIYELKYFFANSVLSDKNNDISSVTVKSCIKSNIEKESPQNPLSDEKLANLVHEQLGVIIARRTISKYREECGFPTSAKRKCPE